MSRHPYLSNTQPSLLSPELLDDYIDEPEGQLRSPSQSLQSSFNQSQKFSISLNDPTRLHSHENTCHCSPEIDSKPIIESDNDESPTTSQESIAYPNS